MPGKLSLETRAQLAELNRMLNTMYEEARLLERTFLQDMLSINANIRRVCRQADILLEREQTRALQQGVDRQGRAAEDWLQYLHDTRRSLTNDGYCEVEAHASVRLPVCRDLLIDPELREIQIKNEDV